MKEKIIIGLTYGDPAGIGPEILFTSLTKQKHDFIPYIVGLEKHLPELNLEKKYNLRFHNFSKKIKLFNFKSGHPSKATGKFGFNCLKESVRLALEQKINALVTGPLSKSVVNLSTSGFKGQTDEIAKLCKKNTNDVIMLFVSGDFRLALFSRHLSLRSVPHYLTKTRLEKFLLILNAELKKWFRIKSPKIAILGFNPHAGESGLLGSEEEKIILPVIKRLSLTGLKLYGPFSADAMLRKACQDYLLKKKQKYDVYVSFYHDQGLPAFKGVAGFKGVNLTLGLPFLRVSVDHGTGFDIAGKGKASAESLVSAINLIKDLL